MLGMFLSVREEMQGDLALRTGGVDGTDEAQMDRAWGLLGSASVMRSAPATSSALPDSTGSRG